MKITQLNTKEFCSVLLEFKDEISKNKDEWADEGDHIEVMLNSVDILIKELHGVDDLNSLNLEKKKILFPHISFVYNYMNYLTSEDEFEGDFFEDFDDEDFDDEDDFEWEEGNEETPNKEDSEEESKKNKSHQNLKIAPKTNSGCCENNSCKTDKTKSKKTK